MGTLIGTLALAPPLQANGPSATISYFDRTLHEFALRLGSELRAQGYSVQLKARRSEPGCDAPVSPLLPTTERALIQLGVSQDETRAVCAIVAYAAEGAARRQTVATTAYDDLERFTITIAEALNGLRASAPPAPTTLSKEGLTNQGREVQTSAGGSLASESTQQHAFVLESSLLIDAEQPEPILALGAHSELRLGASFDLLLESLVTVTPLGLSEGDTELAAHFAWTRLGLSYELLREPLSVSFSLMAGPALTWVTARTAAPRIARADAAASALFTLGASAAYPSNTPVFVTSSTRASTLLPQIRFQLPSGPTAPFGRILAEISAGVGVRWF